MLQPFSDEQILIKALVNGNKEAFSFLSNIYFQKLCTYAFTLSRSQDLAEDIVQNVFLRLWKDREKLVHIRRLKSFLYGAVYNEFIDQYRQSKKVMTLEKKHIESLTSFLEEETNEDLDNLIQLVQKEIENLPNKCKEVFLLSKKEGLTNIEISDYLNTSLKSVEAHITKAFNILRLKIKKNNF